MPLLHSLLTRIILLLALSGLYNTCHGEPLPPDLDYFPSRLHAAVFRNWDIVPHERIAEVLSTDKRGIQKIGRELGLTVPNPLTREEIHRNVEMVLRRNWGVLPRTQIEGLLGFTPAQWDEVLRKEISVRALLAGPPPGLTPLAYQASDPETENRARWFAENARKHLESVKFTPEEPRLGYTNELCRAHNPADFVPGTKPKKGDADLLRGWKMEIPAKATDFLRHAAEDFVDYCKEVHDCNKMPIVSKAGSGKSIRLQQTNERMKSEEAYVLTINPKHIEIQSSTEVGLARALVELEHRMAERGGPFLRPADETNSPAFSPRYVYSYFSTFTDVLGQDAIEGHPDGYLNQLFHQDADGVWVYALLEDLVASPVIPEIKKEGSEERLRRLRELVERAAKRGLKVYLYLNEPRAQFHSFFAKYPELKGHAEAESAALCTSTELVRKHIRQSFEKLFREVPGLGGVFVITASENLTNCYSHGAKTNCPRCAKRAPADVVAEVIRTMTEGAWAANPKARFIVWDWSWHSVMGESAPEKIISKLPKGVELMADFERGTRIERGGVPMNVEEYSISVIGPSPRARIRSEQAKAGGYNFLAKIQLSTTWECGTVPFITVPNLLWKKAEALQSVNASGVMGSWSVGSYPSPNTEAFAMKNWYPNLPEAEALRRIAARRYGEVAADDAVRGWTKMSAAFHEEYPFSVSPYAGPMQHGPSLPWYKRDIAPPYGSTTLFNPKDDWRNWTPPYPQDVMARLLFHLADRWDDGLSDLRAAAAKAPADRKKLAEQDLGVAWMFAYYCRSYANTLHFYGARDGGDPVEMKRRATDELRLTQEAFRLVRADSRLGWQAELQYFYRPLDVLEKLISLDAVLTPVN